MNKVDLSLNADQFLKEYGRKKYVSTYTLGCKVNQYETQALKEKFVNAGYEIVNEGEFADIYIINTCTVTGLSDKKSKQFIRRAKRLNPNSITAVIGCFAQVSPEEAEVIPGVNIVAGTNEKNRLLELVEEEAVKGKTSTAVNRQVLPLKELNKYESTGIITAMESRTRAYIKVQEGCNRFCSYCIIPFARGDVRSRDYREILEEAKNLLDKGFKELVLTGINMALYDGNESFCGNSFGLAELVGKINELQGDFRIRIGSLEPTVIDKDYALGLLKYEKLCRHFHLSLQSGSDKILKEMNRNYTSSDFMGLVHALKKELPYFGLTTDIIVGFPGETEEDFRESVRISEETGFSKVHVFKYSKRKGTAAAEMKGHISPDVKTRRSKELIIASEISTKKYHENCLDHEVRVLFETLDEKSGYSFGRSDENIPVYCEEKVGLNKFYKLNLISLYKDGAKGVLR